MKFEINIQIYKWKIFERSTLVYERINFYNLLNIVKILSIIIISVDIISN